VLKQLSDARLVVSVLHRPTIDIHPFSILPSRVRRAFAPDLVFSHNPSDTRDLESVFDKVELLPNGVDLEAFSPPTEAKKLAYRDRFDIGYDQFVVLHVGHLKRDRNVTSLLELQDDDCQVVVVASEYLEYSSTIAAELRDAGCTLIVGYRDDLDAIYGLADCYAFPVESGNTLDMPLSVLEAMSCNLPVVTLEHPGLTALFAPGDGLWVEPTLPRLLKTIRTVRATDPEVETRQKVRDYSWDAVATRALESYQCL
jgi:glycosyltransferase involved in cell wall biosynthesis